MFLLQSDNFLNCPLQIFNSILKTSTIQKSIMSFIVTFYKNVFLPPIPPLILFFQRSDNLIPDNWIHRDKHND